MTLCLDGLARRVGLPPGRAQLRKFQFDPDSTLYEMYLCERLPCSNAMHYAAYGKNSRSFLSTMMG